MRDPFPALLQLLDYSIQPFFELLAILPATRKKPKAMNLD
jgi:hypothetical protein